MNARFFLVVVLMLAVLAISSCAGGGSNPASVDPTNLARNDQWSPGDPYIVPIIAGQNYIAGEVTVTNDSDTIFFNVTMFDDWFLYEVHIQAVTDPDDFPRNDKGRLVPGQFDFYMDLNPPVQSYVFEYPMPDMDPGDEYFFAFHCVVQSATYGQQTGWGGTCEGQWSQGYYCDDTWDNCVEGIELPGCTGNYHAKYYYPGTLGSYWNVLLYDFPIGYDLYNGWWPGWCVQKNVYAYPGVAYPICAYSFYDEESNLPPLLQAIHWDRIAYILNHKHPNATVMDIQQAIWYYTLNYPSYNPPADTETWAMINDAEANGEGFVPGHGELMGVVLYAGPNVQAIFVELEVFCL